MIFPQKAAPLMREAVGGQAEEMIAKADTIRVFGCLPNCETCKRTMIPNERFANGYEDGPIICHACKFRRDVELGEELDSMVAWG